LPLVPVKVPAARIRRVPAAFIANARQLVSPAGVVMGVNEVPPLVDSSTCPVAPDMVAAMMSPLTDVSIEVYVPAAALPCTQVAPRSRETNRPVLVPAKSVLPATAMVLPSSDTATRYQPPGLAEPPRGTGRTAKVAPPSVDTCTSPACVASPCVTATTTEPSAEPSIARQRFTPAALPPAVVKLAPPLLET
jgi:hypothetical protein